MTPQTLLIIRKPPFGNLDSWEGLRLSLSFYASDAPVAVLLQGAGVLNWLGGIVRESKDPHSVSRLVDDISRFGITVFLIEEDLAEHGLTRNDLASLSPKVISRRDAALLIANYETTIAM